MTAPVHEGPFQRFVAVSWGEGKIYPRLTVQQISSPDRLWYIATERCFMQDTEHLATQPWHWLQFVIAEITRFWRPDWTLDEVINSTITGRTSGNVFRAADHVDKFWCTNPTLGSLYSGGVGLFVGGAPPPIPDPGSDAYAFPNSARITSDTTPDLIRLDYFINPQLAGADLVDFYTWVLGEDLNWNWPGS